MQPAEGTIVLKPGREKSVLRGHPWIFSGAIGSKRGLVREGAVVDVLHAEGSWLGRGLVNPSDNLSVRLYTRDETKSVNEDFFRSQLEAAIRLRAECGLGNSKQTTAYRICFSEADGLSGLIVDRFGDLLVVQISTVTLISYLPAMIDCLQKATKCRQVLVTASDPERMGESYQPAELERLSTYQGKPVAFCEHGHSFEVDPVQGQKTGFYVDQRCNRMRVSKYAAGREILNVYCYTGGFDVYAAKAGATSVVGVDSSDHALTQAQRHVEMNDVSEVATFRKGDGPTVMRSYRDSRTSFDMIVLDPPRFVANRHQLDKGLRAYKDINLMGCKLLRPGGLLASFSCSGWVNGEQFLQTIRWAAEDAGRRIRVLESLSQPADHPFDLYIPETRYLTGFICQVV